MTDTDLSRSAGLLLVAALRAVGPAEAADCSDQVAVYGGAGCER